MARVLVVDDEPAVRRALERALRLDNHEVSLAADGEEALDALASAPADAVILDILMPKLDGLEVCRRLRKAGDRTPVLMLTARDAIDDRVKGLDVGADDYLVKPFALRELQARLRALLRRSGDGTADGEPLRYGDLVLDPVAHEVHRGDRLIELSRTEFLLLELFMRHPRQVLTRSTIFENVWGYDFGPTSNALGVYMGYLRRKTEAGDEPRLLHTIRGVGYVLRRIRSAALSLRKRLSLIAAASVGGRGPDRGRRLLHGRAQPAPRARSTTSSMPSRRSWLRTSAFTRSASRSPVCPPAPAARLSTARSSLADGQSQIEEGSTLPLPISDGARGGWPRRRRVLQRSGSARPSCGC